MPTNLLELSACIRRLRVRDAGFGMQDSCVSRLGKPSLCNRFYYIQYLLGLSTGIRTKNKKIGFLQGYASTGRASLSVWSERFRWAQADDRCPRLFLHPGRRRTESVLLTEYRAAGGKAALFSGQVIRSCTAFFTAGHILPRGSTIPLWVPRYRLRCPGGLCLPGIRCPLWDR